MSGEILNAAVLAFTLVLVGLGLGYLMLKLTPEGEDLRGDDESGVR